MAASKRQFPEMEYWEDVNVFCIQFHPGPGDGGVSEIAPGVLATFDADDRLLAIELEGDVAKEYPELVEGMRRLGLVLRA